MLLLTNNKYFRGAFVVNNWIDDRDRYYNYGVLDTLSDLALITLEQKNELLKPLNDNDPEIFTKQLEIHNSKIIKKLHLSLT